MATPGKAAFTPETHQELLKLAPLLSDLELAVKFDASLPTIAKWKRKPLGYKPGKSGRPIKKARSTGMDAGHDSPKAVGTDANKNTAFAKPSASAHGGN